MLPCRCCEYLTMEEYDNYDICPVCFWEDDYDRLAKGDENVTWGPNYTSLTEAKENFKKFGSCEERTSVYCRKPKLEEIPNV